MRPVPQYDPKNWLLKALRETAHAMEAIIWNVDEDVLDRAPVEDEWSPRELLVHMAESERRYVERLERMVTSDEPRIAAFDADSIEAEQLEHRDIFDAIDDFGAQRQRTVYLLWSLDDGDWHRKGIHPYLGPLTVLDVAREMNEHDLAHLWQLRRTCDAFEAASV
jgi:hypothetical protein